MMWNRPWLLCLVVIGLAMRSASSMNEQPRSKNESSKTPNSDEKKESHDGYAVKDKDQVLLSSPLATVPSDVLTNSTSSNATVALVPDTGASTSINATKLGSHDQSYPKRHFHRSKLYRKESRAKSRASLTKSNVAIGNLQTPSNAADHLVGPTQDLVHNADNISDSMKLKIKSTPKTSGTSPSKTSAATVTSYDDSMLTASPRLVFTNGSEETSERKFDKLSSRITVGSASTESSTDNSSSSSEEESVIDEKSSSVELMAFTFDSMEKLDQSTFTNEVMKRVENLTTSASIAMDHSSSTTAIITASEPSDILIDKSRSTSADFIQGGIDLGQSIQSAGNDVDDDLIIYSVHTEPSRDADRLSNESFTSVERDNMTKNDSVILVSVTSESSVSKNSRDTSTKGIGKIENESNLTSLENNSNHNRPDIDGSSWVSIDDSLNRISLDEVIDTLKNVGLQENRDSYSYSDSTLSQGTNSSSDSKLQIIETGPASTKHSRSLTIPDVAQRPRESGPSMSGIPDANLSDHFHASPDSSSIERIDRPLKLIIPLDTEEIAKAMTKNNVIVEDVNLSRPSTSADSSSINTASDKSLASRKDEPVRFILDLGGSSSRCSSNSSTEQLQDMRRIHIVNPFYQRRSNEMTLSVPGNSISGPEQCLTRRSIAQTSLVSPVISSNSEETEVSLPPPVNRSHEIETRVRNSSASAIDENPGGAQSVFSSGLIILENFEPVVRESLASEEPIAPFETETPTAGHVSPVFADLEEQCNASSSSNIFIPSVNSRESIAAVEPEEESSLMSREPQNLTTTEDSLYIIEGFGFLKNSADEFSELEEEFDRRRDAVAFDYSETEIYPGYPQLDDHPLEVKLIDQIEFEAELPIKQEPLIAAGLQWKGNIGERNYDQWWFNDESKQRTRQAKNDEAEKRAVLIPSGFSSSKEIRVIPSLTDKVSPDMNESDINSYRIFLLPTVYVLIGICIILVGCSIWCSKVPVKRQPNLPKLTYFIQERQGATEAVV